MLNTKPCVLVLYHFFYPDDVVSAQHFSQFSVELVRRGWEVNVLTSNRYCRYPDKKIKQKEELWNGVLIYRSSRPVWNQANNYLRILNSIWLIISWAIRLLRMPSSDVIVIGTDPQFSALLFPLLRFLKKGRVFVHWCYDLYPDAIIADGAKGVEKIIARKITFLMKWAYRSIDCMVDIGTCMRKRLESYQHKAKSITLVPWALVEPPQISRPDPLLRRELFGDAKLTLLYSGNMGKAHDYSIFLQLARRMYKEDAKIIFCFACRGNRFDELKNSVRPDDYNIHFAPFVNESELERRLNSADIHLLSLRPEWEGIVIPSKFFGSLAVGKPILYAGPDGTAIADWINEYNIGLVLNRENIDKCIEKLLELVQNPDQLKVWGENAYRAYHKYFSKQQIMNQWDSLLRELIGYSREALEGSGS